MGPDEWIALGAATVALGTLVKAVVEYRRQISLKRFEAFQAMLKRFNEHAKFEELADLCHDDDPELAGYHVHDKTDYAGFFEELALMVNSGLLRRAVVSQMFGTYLDECAASQQFWTPPYFDPKDYHWREFHAFAARMRAHAKQDRKRPPSKWRFRF